MVNSEASIKDEHYIFPKFNFNVLISHVITADILGADDFMQYVGEKLCLPLRGLICEIQVMPFSRLSGIVTAYQGKCSWVIRHKIYVTHARVHWSQLRTLYSVVVWNSIRGAWKCARSARIATHHGWASSVLFVDSRGCCRSSSLCTRVFLLVWDREWRAALRIYMMSAKEKLGTSVQHVKLNWLTDFWYLQKGLKNFVIDVGSSARHNCREESLWQCVSLLSEYPLLAGQQVHIDLHNNHTHPLVACHCKELY